LIIENVIKEAIIQQLAVNKNIAIKLKWMKI